MPKKGQTQPYKVFTTYPPSQHLPEGRQMLNAFTTAGDADRAARQPAYMGNGTGEVFYYSAEHNKYALVFVYTPDNVREIGDIPPKIHKNTDILRWYQEMGFEPQYLDKRPAKGRVPAKGIMPPATARPPAAKETTMTDETPPLHTMTDEELWNSPAGERLRHYADKLLAAEAERITANPKRRQADGVVAEGIQFARAIVSPLGDPSTMISHDDGTPARADTDPWANWQSPEVTGLREAVKDHWKDREAALKAAKAYIASLQGNERPAAEEPTEAPAAVEKRPATPLDVAGALSYLLTGHAASDRGPFAVHEADGFHDEPYVILSVESMSKILDRLPEGTW